MSEAQNRGKEREEALDRSLAVVIINSLPEIPVLGISFKELLRRIAISHVLDRQIGQSVQDVALARDNQLRRVLIKLSIGHRREDLVYRIGMTTMKNKFGFLRPVYFLTKRMES